MNGYVDNARMRTFPEPDQEMLIAYIYHTHRLDRIPMDRARIEKTLGKTDSDPYVAGHLRAITLVLQLAEDETLLKECPNRFQLEASIGWLKRLHRNIMRPIAELGLQAEDATVIHPSDIGVFRSQEYIHRSAFGNFQAPNPYDIPELLYKWNNRVVKVQNENLNTIQYGMYSQEEGGELANQCKKLSLELFAIRPFEDGNSATSRLVENLLRLHWGLPWKIIAHKSEDADTYYEERRRELERFNT